MFSHPVQKKAYDARVVVGMAIGLIVPIHISPRSSPHKGVGPLRANGIIRSVLGSPRLTRRS